MIPIWKQERLDDALKEFPGLPQLFKAFQNLVSPEDLAEQVFTERDVDDVFDGEFPYSYILPAIGPFRINDVKVGGQEVHFYILATSTGSSWQLKSFDVIFRFYTPDDIKFDWQHCDDFDFRKVRIETCVD